MTLEEPYPDPRDVVFRAIGFTREAAKYPLSERAFLWLCSFNGITVRQAPSSWRYAPNPYMQSYLDKRAAAELTAP